MSEKFPNPTQININRKGGLYDQAIQENINRDGGLYDEALAEDAQRAQMLPPNVNNDLINYVSEQVLNEGTRQHQTLDQDNALNAVLEQQLEADTKWQQKRDQDEAYATYADNIEATQKHEKAEYKEIRNKLRRAKVRRGLGRLAAGALLIPGVDVIADIVEEELVTTKLNKKRRTGYKSRNGTLLGNKQKGYSSVIGEAYKKRRARFNNKNDVEIYKLEELLAERSREKTLQ